MVIKKSQASSLLAGTNFTQWVRLGVYSTVGTLTSLLLLVRISARIPRLAVFPAWPIFSHPNGLNPCSPYGCFPSSEDSFHFIPCTNVSIPPPLDEQDPAQAWAALFDPEPRHWRWGNTTGEDSGMGIDGYDNVETFEKRGIYLCGYLDLPLDYTNKSDSRIVRLAVTKFQVSGLAKRQSGSKHTWPWKPRDVGSSADQKSERTIVIQPGGPGASGTREVWNAAESISQRLSHGRFDVLGWDPRGVNISHPAMSCYPHDSYRNRWELFKGQYREEVEPHSRIQHLRTLDAMNNATFHVCQQRHGDLGRFVHTSFVARDLEEIRKALDEDELTGYFVSYGTSIGSTYASLFPERVGRLILDSVMYIKDHRELGGFAMTLMNDVFLTWHEGLLKECLRAGPQHCLLATLDDGSSRIPITLRRLELRMKQLFQSLIEQPLASYTNTGIPTIVTYSRLVQFIRVTLYDPRRWPLTVQMLYDLENGNATTAASALEKFWYTVPPATPNPLLPKTSSFELTSIVICADAYDAPQPGNDLDWWDGFWERLTEESWMAAGFTFNLGFACRHFQANWPNPPGVYRGDLNHTLRNPALLISGTHDPATPLKHAKKLMEEMGDNCRFIVHHGYGHISDADPSDCTDALARAYIVNGTLPDHMETHCYANDKPFLTKESVQDNELLYH